MVHIKLLSRMKQEWLYGLLISHRGVIRVAYDRIQQCSDEIPDKFWPTSVQNGKRLNISSVPSSSRDNIHGGVDTERSISGVTMLGHNDDRRCMQSERRQMEEINCWKDCLRPRRNCAGGDT